MNFKILIGGLLCIGIGMLLGYQFKLQEGIIQSYQANIKGNEFHDESIGLLKHAVQLEMDGKGIIEDGMIVSYLRDYREQRLKMSESELKAIGSLDLLADLNTLLAELDTGRE